MLNDKGGFDTRFGYDRVGHRTRVGYLSGEAVEEAMLKEGYIKTHTERTRRKQSIRTNTYKLLAKAQANTQAVENGTFGVGH